MKIVLLIFLAEVFFISTYAQNRFKIEYSKTGEGISLIANISDKHNMNWVSDSTSYSMKKWEINNYKALTGNHDNGVLTKSWGEGFCIIESLGKKELFTWKVPYLFYCKKNAFHAEYEFNEVTLSVDRYPTINGEFAENYSFFNRSNKLVSIRNIHIYTPFADNYPDAETCITNRCHTHIWTGKNCGYVNAFRMGGQYPHLGMALVHGSLEGYSYENKWSSNTRGTLSLHFQDLTIKSKQEESISWKLFWHLGWKDFFEKLENQYNYVVGYASKYCIQKGEMVHVVFSSAGQIKSPQCFVNKSPISYQTKKGQIVIYYMPAKSGEYEFKLKWAHNKETVVKILVTIPIDKLIKNRVDFILNHQQINDPMNEKDGAFLVYDNEKNKPYFNDDLNKRDDTDEGAERLGMGVLMAMYMQMDTSIKYRNSAERYYALVRNKLQTNDYKVFSTIDHKSRHRAYNYPWVANFYLEMYAATSNKQYLKDYYYTMMSFFNSFGFNFYAIGIPVKKGIEMLEIAGMIGKRDSLITMFKHKGDKMLESSTHYPAHEVNYEQGIVGPSVVYLCELYQVTGSKKYIEEAKKHLLLLEAFNGLQPDYHLYEIPIRHWDGYWFGKKRMWGDTFPHYWSAISAIAFWQYYQATGEKQYLEKANRILESNLCLFTSTGEGHCAYIYPEKVNNIEGKFFDPYSNDQDWALVYYLTVKNSNFSGKNQKK